MKARVKATGEIWTFSQIDEITFKSAINRHLYCAEELEFLEPSVFSPDYWTHLEHQYAGMAMQGILSNQEYVHSLVQRVASREILNLAEGITKHAEQLAHALIQKLKEKEERK